MAKFYAVRVGRNPGIYEDWAQAKLQVHKYSGAEFKGFTDKNEAEAWLQGIPDEATQQSEVPTNAVLLPWESN
jgi:ribonuclease HI